MTAKPKMPPMRSAKGAKNDFSLPLIRKASAECLESDREQTFRVGAEKLTLERQKMTAYSRADSAYGLESAKRSARRKCHFSSGFGK